MATDDGVDNHDDDDKDGDDHERADISADDNVHGERYRFPRTTMHAHGIQELLSYFTLDLLNRASSTTRWERHRMPSVQLQRDSASTRDAPRHP